MRIRRIAARAVLPVLFVAALCVVAPSALAVEYPGKIQENSTTVTLPNKDDFSTVNVTFTCLAGETFEPGDVSGQYCRGTLDLQMSRTAERYYFRENEWVPFVSVPIDVPVGVNTIAVPTPTLETTLLTRTPGPTGGVTRTLRATHVNTLGERISLLDDGAADATGARKGSLSFSWSTMMRSPCAMIPASLPITTTVAPSRFVTWNIDGFKGEVKRTTPETGTTSINSRVTYIARAPITLKLNGISYTIATGSQFALQCSKWGNGSPTSKNVSPHLWLEYGKVTVVGKPVGAKQFGAGVRVRPGFFGSERPSTRVNFTVQTSGRLYGSNFAATMRSRAGSISAFQLFKLAPSAHCTAGQGVRIRIDGATTLL